MERISEARLLPTSHIQVGRGRVAHAFHVSRYTLVLPLISLLGVLDLQGPCEEGAAPKRMREKERESREKEQRHDEKKETIFINPL